MLGRTRFSLNGWSTAWRSEGSLRLHVAVSLVAMAALAMAGASAWWLAVVAFAVAACWAVELLNAAIEALCDTLHPEHHPGIGATKDIASAAAFTVNMGLFVLVALALYVALQP
ncbi:hypothetical protein AAW00_12070 [Aurantiacibacter luteus]|uniref:Diacylglycerol kinase n=1 Tax=Aurantiacibacter luteus TaxID=1581420 RepID=A0A0G9MT27_9SPHN|nr:hypothetical protein AAW00_12070 [Aurantiacibacter luteus]